MKNMVQVAVKGLAIDERSKSPVVILQEVGGQQRAVPIWIGPAEASAIAMEVAGKKFQRPLTHDLMVTIIEGLKAKVTRVVISELRDNTYYAHIFLERRKEIVSIDARPSDSIAIALRTKSPIFISDRLLDGQLAEAGAGESGPEERPREKTDAERSEELRKRLEAMDPEDFGKFSL